MIERIEAIDYTKEKSALQEDALEYISGFVIFACDKYMRSGDDYFEEDEEYNDADHTFVQLANNGGLVIPPKNYTKKIMELEKIFRDTEISSDNIMTKLLSGSQEISLETDMKRRFFKTRINARIRYLNKCIKDAASSNTSNKRTSVQNKINKLKTYFIVL